MIKRLRECRIEKGINQQEMADKLNVTQQTYSDYERGKTNPNIDTLLNMADILGTSLDYLLGRSDEFNNVTIYQHTNTLDSLSPEEQKIIDVFRRKTPSECIDFVCMYSEIPLYMQQSIFAELKGMHLGYTVSKNKSTKENSK